jgi:hypothetical protein
MCAQALLDASQPFAPLSTVKRFVWFFNRPYLIYNTFTKYLYEFTTHLETQRTGFHSLHYNWNKRRS